MWCVQGWEIPRRSVILEALGPYHVFFARERTLKEKNKLYGHSARKELNYKMIQEILKEEERLITIHQQSQAEQIPSSVHDT